MARRPRTPRRPPAVELPDVRDGLTRLERVILWQLGEAQRERGDANVPTARRSPGAMRGPLMPPPLPAHGGPARASRA